MWECFLDLNAPLFSIKLTYIYTLISTDNDIYVLGK